MSKQSKTPKPRSTRPSSSSRKKSTHVKLFAFWEHAFLHYGGFGGVLGGEISEVLPDGDVRVPSYSNMIVDPVRLVPVEEGKKLLESVEALRAEYTKAMKEVTRQYEARFKKLFTP